MTPTQTTQYYSSIVLYIIIIIIVFYYCYYGFHCCYNIINNDNCKSLQIHIHLLSVWFPQDGSYLLTPV